MSLHPRDGYGVPGETARVARSCLPDDHPYLLLQEALGAVFRDQEFADLFPARGQPALAPGRLAMVTVLQFAERLPDRQAADAVRGRIDWKYLLALELTDPGFDASVLSEFRTRLVEQGAASRLFDVLLERVCDYGLVKAGGRQRTDSTHVLAAIRALNRLVLVGETLRAALNALAVVAPEWLTSVVPTPWSTRYGPQFEHARLPSGQAKCRAMVERIGADGERLLGLIYGSEAPAYLRQIPAVEVLRQVWVQNDHPRDEGAPTWRERTDIPPSRRFISSPYDTDARYARKSQTQWIGYRVHLTETCDDADAPPLITQVTTTAAPSDDGQATDPIHAALAAKGLLPARHLVDSGYVDTELRVDSRRRYGVDLCGPVRGNLRWQARTEGAYALGDFTIDWDRQRAVCPQGHSSVGWIAVRDRHGNPSIKVKFAKRHCGPCLQRSRCTRQTRRNLSLRPREQHEALIANRARQGSDEFKAERARRSGIEGTLSFGVRACRMRRTRYIGQAKTHLQHCMIAAALNLIRFARWLAGQMPAPTRVTPFQKLRRGTA